MRFSTPVEYETITQALLKGTCPFCTYLKNYQSKVLRELRDPGQIISVCNFHAWAMAAASDKAVVSCVFRVLIRERAVKETRECSLCKMIAAEEQSRMKEFAGQISQTRVLDWVKTQGTFCIPHGTRFLAYVPRPMQELVLNVLSRNTAQLQDALEHVVADKSDDKGPGGGLLGHAAEFLVSQRGL